jgi:LysM repeat protein
MVLMRSERMTRFFKLAVIVLMALLVTFPAAAQEPTTYVVRPGDNLFRIAQQHNVTVAAIAEANNISNTWQIFAGQRLIIPQRGQPAVQPTAAPEQATAAPQPTAQPAPEVDAQYHVIRWGESLSAIATRYGLTMRQLMDLNNINNPNLIYAGQRLVVSAGTATDSGSESNLPVTIRPSGIEHVVQTGERLSGIAQLYGVSWLAIVELNSIPDPNRIEAGQTLLIPSAANSAVAPTLFVPDAPPPTRTVGRELIVSLSNFRTYAYEDGRLVRSILVSIGREATPTIVGSFRIQRKYQAQTMTGPGYYLPGVPYVMYFYGGYAFHGTFWHDNWGARMSHGCVNLPTPEAEWLYNFADIGTPVTILA